MFGLIRNKKSFYTTAISFLALLLLTSFANSKQVEERKTSDVLSFQQTTISHSEQAIINAIEYYFVAVDSSAFQKDSGKNTFGLKIFLPIVYQEESFLKNLSLLIADSQILVGESNLLKIIFPFHEFW